MRFLSFDGMIGQLAGHARRLLSSNLSPGWPLRTVFLRESYEYPVDDGIRIRFEPDACPDTFHTGSILFYVQDVPVVILRDGEITNRKLASLFGSGLVASLIGELAGRPDDDVQLRISGHLDRIFRASLRSFADIRRIWRDRCERATERELDSLPMLLETVHRLPVQQRIDRIRTRRVLLGHDAMELGTGSVAINRIIQAMMMFETLQGSDVQAYRSAVRAAGQLLIGGMNLMAIDLLTRINWSLYTGNLVLRMGRTVFLVGPDSYYPRVHILRGDELHIDRIGRGWRRLSPERLFDGDIRAICSALRLLFTSEPDRIQPVTDERILAIYDERTMLEEPAYCR
ncbi:MAG: hypothetical protein KatS3mg023_3618 [Armatimonadota bacterium]|nr:MAG: hypothetical protein KatS3mg023_3618 [Armatimonadota bacterium]